MRIELVITITVPKMILKFLNKSYFMLKLN